MRRMIEKVAGTEIAEKICNGPTEAGRQISTFSGIDDPRGRVLAEMQASEALRQEKLGNGGAAQQHLGKLTTILNELGYLEADSRLPELA